MYGFPMAKKSKPKPKARHSKRDTTPQQAQAQTFQRNAADFKKLADNANDVIVVLARDGHHLYANKAKAAAIAGYSVSELLKIGIDQATHPDELPKVKKYERIHSGGPVQVVMRRPSSEKAARLCP